MTSRTLIIETHGRGLDIYLANGQPASRDNADARELAELLAALNGELRPDGVGPPWPDLTDSPGFFSDAAHQRHLHLGWK